MHRVASSRGASGKCKAKARGYGQLQQLTCLWGFQGLKMMTVMMMIVPGFFSENIKFTIVPYGETKNLNYLENEQSSSSRQNS